jgi:choline-sulfatase
VPLIACGPGIPAGGTCDALVELSDVNPTICELAGLPRQPGIDARSFAPCLEDASRPHRDEIVTALDTWHCVRTARHKLIRNWNDDPEFYDLGEDPNEERNVYGETRDADPALLRDLERREHLRHKRSPHGAPREGWSTE